MFLLTAVCLGIAETTGFHHQENDPRMRFTKLTHHEFIVVIYFDQIERRNFSIIISSGIQLLTPYVYS